MAKCKFCGQGVRTAPVFHPACWEQAVNKLAGEICDEYCKFPFELDYEALVDEAIRLGVEHAFIQEGSAADESFIPAFDYEGV